MNCEQMYLCYSIIIHQGSTDPSGTSFVIMMSDGSGTGVSEICDMDEWPL